MEYGIRSHGLSVNGGGPAPNSWLESAMASAVYSNPLATAYQLPSSAALLLNSLQALQSSATAIELARRAARQAAAAEDDDDDEDEEEEEEEEDEDEEEDDEEEDNEENGRVPTNGEEAHRPRVGANGTASPEHEHEHEDEDEDEDGGEEEYEYEENGMDGAAKEQGQDEQDEEEEVMEENEVSAESWRETPMPVLSGWMLSAYTSMLGRLSAATAALEAAESSNLPPSDSDSESDRSSYTDILSRVSSPGADACPGSNETGTRTKKKRTNEPAGITPTTSNDKEASSSDASSATSQGKKRSLALQRVRYRYEREEYRCSLCSYACTIEKAFQRHLRAHARGTASESRVSCAVCGADRSSEVDLSKHMRRHRDNRYFCCDICIFRTVQLKKLIQHRRMHTGEKPHLCPHCAYRSARRDNLRSHVRRVHKKENLYCDTFSPRGMFIAPKQRPIAEEETRSGRLGPADSR